jgi:hypothetical protein
MFWLTAKTFYTVSSKVYTGADTHAPGLPVPTQALLDLVSSVSGTNRNITTDNYYTSIPLPMELKSRKLTLVGKMKKNKACIRPTFLAKADEGTVQHAFDHANNFTLLNRCSKEKQEGRLPVHYTFRKKDRRGYWERRYKRVLQPGKRWCGQSRSKVQLVHHGKKHKPLANEAVLWND